MSDIIETIDRLHADVCRTLLRGGSVNEILSAVQAVGHATVNNWPALRDRLREAERRAKAFDLIASKVVYAVMCGDKWAAKQKGTSGLSSLDFDLLTAIEAATREAET